MKAQKETYKSDVFCGDVVVNPVPGAVVHHGPFELGAPIPGSGRVILDKLRLFHQEVEDEAGQLEADGDEEEDYGVLLLIRQEELGEDAAEGDDHPSGA